MQEIKKEKYIFYVFCCHTCGQASLIQLPQHLSIDLGAVRLSQGSKVRGRIYVHQGQAVRAVVPSIHQPLHCSSLLHRVNFPRQSASVLHRRQRDTVKMSHAFASHLFNNGCICGREWNKVVSKPEKCKDVLHDRIFTPALYACMYWVVWFLFICISFHRCFILHTLLLQLHIGCSYTLLCILR